MPINEGTPIPVNIVGGSSFGLYPKISIEKTYNMFVSDNWLVSYAGYKKVANVETDGVGRGFFRSVRGGFDIAVIGSSVYRFFGGSGVSFAGSIKTSRGEVSIDENLNSQICIVDGEDAYIYNYNSPNAAITPQNLSTTGSVQFTPGYVCYQNTFFLFGSAEYSDNPFQWYAFEGTVDSPNITHVSGSTFKIQTKPDNALAVKRLPGRGNHVIVFGSTVSEVWSQVGGAENYRRNSSFNIDYGVVSVNTIAASDKFVCWLGKNENNAPSIMFTDGSNHERISTDGIDKLMAGIKEPEFSTALFYKQDGHLFYQITFYGTQDNLSLIYDFNTKMFFHVTDENLNYHPARQMVYSNEKTYFVSLKDGGIYEINPEFNGFNYNVSTPSYDETDSITIPRIRICKTVRADNSSTFRIKNFGFWMEQGVQTVYSETSGEEDCTGLLVDETGTFRLVSQDGIPLMAQYGYCSLESRRPRVDFSFSKDGNQSFSNIVGHELNENAKYRNQIFFNQLGRANEFTVQLRFWGLQRFVVQNGFVELF